MKESNKEIIEDIAELKGDVKYMTQILSKVEKVLEAQASLSEKNNYTNKRIDNLEEKVKTEIKSIEEKGEKRDSKIRKLEDWQIKIIAIASIVSTIGATLVGFVLSNI